MQVDSLIADLAKASGANRQLDARIALAVGFRRISDSDPVGSKPIWLSPSGEQINTIPFYTRSLDSAFRLVSSAGSAEDWAFGWEPGIASARLGDDLPCEAATPALALCIAALRRAFATF